jgi:hypothetical protein
MTLLVLLLGAEAGSCARGRSSRRPHVVQGRRLPSLTAGRNFGEGQDEQFRSHPPADHVAESRRDQDLFGSWPVPECYGPHPSEMSRQGRVCRGAQPESGLHAPVPANPWSKSASRSPAAPGGYRRRKYAVAKARRRSSGGRLRQMLVGGICVRWASRARR